MRTESSLGTVVNHWSRAVWTSLRASLFAGLTDCRRSRQLPGGGEQGPALKKSLRAVDPLTGEDLIARPQLLDSDLPSRIRVPGPATAVRAVGSWWASATLIKPFAEGDVIPKESECLLTDRYGL